MTAIGGYSFTTDAEGRLKTSTLNGVGVNYGYDGEGHRVTKGGAGGAPVTYVYGVDGELMEEYGNAADAAGGTGFLTKDHLGSTRLVTDAAGGAKSCLDYLPYGEELGNWNGRTAPCYSGNGGRVKFTGKERDAETGLDYFGARYFSGAQGRFTSPDAPFADQHVADPQSWNLYSYTRNNPLRYLDDTGRGVTSAAVKAALRHSLTLARNRGVARAWAAEREALRLGLKGSGIAWNEAERTAILAGNRPKGWIGHHINNVAANSLEMAENPANIKFVKGVAAHQAEHGGSWANKTTGELIDRLAKLSGPALLVFFSVYDEKVSEYTSNSECPMCSDPNSWTTMINPWNNLVESPALLEALAAANARQRQLEEELKRQQERDKQCGMHGEACPGKQQ
jgi:RHS repeat-associated protein